MNVVVSQMAVLFILLAVGYIAGKIKMLTPDGGKILSKVVLNISAPCTILASVTGGEANITSREIAFFTLLSFLAFLLFLLIAIPAVRALGGNKANRGLLCYMSAFGNAAFMGFPVTIAIFGESAAFYVALFNIPFILLTFSVGIIMISGKGGNFNPKTLINPSIFTALLATTIVLTGFKAPAIFADAVRITGSMTTPGAMLVVGCTLSRVSFKDVFSEWRVFPVALLKLIVMPVAVWLVFRQIVTNELMLGVLVVLSGMPAAAMSAMLAIEYGGNERIASSGVSLSTLLSGITIPLVIYMLLR